MTCILGVQTERGVVLAADSQVTFGTEYACAVLPKVWESGPLVVGSSGSVRFSQVVRYHVATGEPPAGDDLLAWLVTTVVPAIRAAVDQYGGKDDTGFFDGSLLIGARGRLYHIDPSGAVHWITRRFEAIGSGGVYALGALEALLQGGDSDPVRAVREAVAIAARFATDCGGAVTIVQTGDG